MNNQKRTIKNNIFVDLFKQKENFLSLYNALHGTNLKLNDTVIEEKSIKNSIYKGIKNDVSMLIDGKIVVLIEHQSTVNKNMPLRCLLYVSRLYEALIPLRARYKYGICKIPSPEFFVIYNGKEDLPAKTELFLSDAFHETKSEQQLELKVTVLNINPGKNLPTVQKCTILNEYSSFIELVRFYENQNSENCYELAIKAAIKKGILTKYLKENSAEVINMLMVDYDYDEDIAAQREEAREIGHAEGLKAGLEEGLQQGIQEGIQQGIQQGLTEGREEGIQQGIKEGIKQGTLQGILQGKTDGLMIMARYMLSEGKSIDEIIKATGLSKSQLEEINK